MTTPLRLLIAEDSETDAKLVLAELRRGGWTIEHVRVEDPVAMRAELARAPWDLIVSDWTMPHFSGAEALAALHESGLDIPFIIVTGTIGEENAVEAMRTGAHDFVLKDRLARLTPAVRRELAERKVRESRRHAQLALRASEERYRRIVETTSQGVWITDAAGRTTFLNGRMTRMLGVGPADVVGRPIDAFLPEADRAAHAPWLARSRPGSDAAELDLLRADGTVLAARMETTPILDDEGRFEGVLAMVTDVTERKRTQEALRLSEARFARLAESGIVGIAFADVLGHLHDANDAYLRMMGFTRDDLAAGRAGWKDRTPPEWAASDAAAVRQLAERGVAAPFEKEMLRKDGSRVPVLVGIAMLDHPHCIAFIADLTERKRAEAALQRTEEQLRQAQKMEAIGCLAGGVAHDFNNLLTVIIGYTDLALGRLDAEDPLRRHLDEVQRASRRATNLTRQLLAVSRRQLLQPRLVDLNDVVSGMTKMLERLVGEDVELRLVPGPRLPRVKVDPGQIEQVLLNLVVNARDAMPRGGKLTIETSSVVLDEHYVAAHVGSTPGPHVLLAVSDTGCGIDAATQARMFEPFFTTKEPGRGTGLGLSTVQGIVAQSGGSVWVYSEVGLGSTFKVYLKALPDGAPGDEAANVPAALEDLGGTETILLVEDDEALRGLTSAILRERGYEVLVAESGADALLVAERHPGPIDLLLTDVVMPRMSGSELAARLAPLRPGIRVLYVSGYTDDAVVRHGILSSDVAFLQKPMTAELLARKVRDVLGPARRG